MIRRRRRNPANPLKSVFIWNSSKFFPNQVIKIDAFNFQIEKGYPISTVGYGDIPGTA
jgi:hypothetical protein